MTVCYLCGLPIEGVATADHIPPQQFFAPELRRRFNLDRMITLPAHGDCNRAYGRDEEYVTNALVPVATGTLAADALIQHHAERFRTGKAVGLGERVLRSFERRPGGLYLPRGLVAVRLDGVRVERVIWKIVRGLYFLEYGVPLSDNTGFFVELQEPENREVTEAQPLWEAVKCEESKGPYQAVFAYKHRRVEQAGIALYLWGMLWWDRIMVFVCHRRSGDVGDSPATIEGV